MRRIYTTLYYALLPLIATRSIWKSRQRGYPTRMRERLGCYGTAIDHPTGVIWFHAVSVGEVEAAIPVIRHLLEHRSSPPILLTCTTPTGSNRIQATFGAQIAHVFLPYDLPDAIERFLNHYQPLIGIILETEIWPNLFRACAQRKLPLAIINARLSESSARGYQKIAGLTRQCMDAVSVIAAQTPEDARRFIEIGASPEKTLVMGNVKFEIQFDQAMQQHSQSLRQNGFPNRKVLIAGSTHPGEEERVLDVLESLRKVLPDCLLILAPRHPERCDQVQSLCTLRGHRVVRRSDQRHCEREDTVLLIDTLGELRSFYGAADVAFVGGSLVPIGGHNLLEPAIAGVPVLFGPHMHHFKSIARQIQECGGGIQVNDCRHLAQHALHLLTHPEEARATGVHGKAFVEANRGALERVTDLIAALLNSLTPKELS